MLEKLRDNPRIVIAVLVTAGVLAFAIGNGGGSSDQDMDQTETATPEVVVNDSSEGSQENESTGVDTESDGVLSSEPEAGAVEVQREGTVYKATVRKGDNQTVVVRQMVDDYVEGQDVELSAEQRLYMETIIVNSLPRDDLVYAGQEIAVDEAVVNDAAEGARDLSEAQIAMWAEYL